MRHQEAKDPVEEDRETSIREKLNKKLSQSPAQVAVEIADLFVEKEVIARSLHELRPAKVPFRHCFELTDDNLVYHKSRRMAPKHNEVVKRDLELMLIAEAIRPPSLAWSLPILIATEKDGKTRLYVDYHV